MLVPYSDSDSIIKIIKSKKRFEDDKKECVTNKNKTKKISCSKSTVH